MDDREQKELEACHEDNPCPRNKTWGVALCGENQDTYYCGASKDEFLFLKCTENRPVIPDNTLIFYRLTLLFQLTQFQGFVQGHTEFTPMISVGKCIPL